MILQGNQRGGARDLARHLMKDENDHVDVHELRGFASDDLMGAFDEAHAVSRGTRAKQFLFSLSLNPPKDADVSTDRFRQAIERAETTLNLTGQPRAIVFHEKEGRRHCHVVWSRIDAQEMKAIPMPHTKRKLMALSRDLYIEHGWEMPKGMINSADRDPKNFTLAQWQQAKRIGKDPRAIKTAMQDAWASSDTQSAFAHALEARGFTLAKGDRRGFVALDERCEVYAISKWVGIKTKDVRAKLGEPDKLPSVQQSRERIAMQMAQSLQVAKDQQQQTIDARLAFIETKRHELVWAQRSAREALAQEQDKRQERERQERQARFRQGFRGLWDRLTGAHRRTVKANEVAYAASCARDQKEKDRLSFEQITVRRSLDSRHARLEDFKTRQADSLDYDIAQYRDIRNQKRDTFDLTQNTKCDGQKLEL